MRGLDNLPHGTHQRLLHHVGDITARETIRHLREHAVVVRLQVRLRVADGELEHPRAAVGVGQADVHAALETSSDRGVELPGDVGRAQHQDALAVVSDTVHLHQQLRLDTPRRLGLALATGPAQGVDLVDEEDRGLVFSRHAEQSLHEPV